MIPDINRLRRRAPGPRVLVALDQSTLSDLALDDGHAGTRVLLRGAVDAGALVCPMSLGATDETLDARGIWEAISDLHEELSMGIEFLDPRQIRQREAFAAAAAFVGQPALYSVVDEAFDRDPQTERDELFAGGFRITARLGPMNVRSIEVAREKSKEAGLQPAYDAARALGRSFEQQAEDEYEQMVRWVLGPLADPSYEAEVERKLHASTRGMMAGGDRGAVSKYQAVAQRKDFAESLVAHSRCWPTARKSSRSPRSWHTCRRFSTQPCSALVLQYDAGASPSPEMDTTSTTSPAGCRVAT